MFEVVALPAIQWIALSIVGDPVIVAPSDMTVFELFDCNRPRAYYPKRGAVVTVALLEVNQRVHKRTRDERFVTSGIIYEPDVTN